MSQEENKTKSQIEDGLMARRTVVLSGKITNQSVSDVMGRMLHLQMRSSDAINLLIDSNGGVASSAFQLCDMIEKVLTAPIHGIAMGACASAATFVMLSCKKRISTPHSRFLIHSGTMNEIAIPINQTTSEHVELLLKDVKTMEVIISRFIRSVSLRQFGRKKSQVKMNS